MEPNQPPPLELELDGSDREGQARHLAPPQADRTRGRDRCKAVCLVDLRPDLRAVEHLQVEIRYVVIPQITALDNSTVYKRSLSADVRKHDIHGSDYEHE